MEESRRVSGNRTAEYLVREYYKELNKQPDKPLAEKPKTEPFFQAEIYLSRHDDGNQVYHVVIGREGTEVPKAIGKFVAIHDISDFLTMPGVEGWVIDRVIALQKQGKPVEFDPSFSYLIARTLHELAAESQQKKFESKYPLN